MTIKPKFEPGDEALYIENDTLKKVAITKLEITVYQDKEMTILYSIDGADPSIDLRHNSAVEEDLFISREELVEKMREATEERLVNLLGKLPEQTATKKKK
jgi:hypothetical protein